MKNLFAKTFEFIKNEPQLLSIPFLVIFYILITNNDLYKLLFGQNTITPLNTQPSNSLNQVQNNASKETNSDITTPTQIPTKSPSNFSISGRHNSESENFNDHGLNDN